MEEVLLRFGEPQEHFDGPTVFLYRWIRRQGTSLFVFPQGGSMDTDGVVEYTLHIAFDENNKVSHYKVSAVPLSGAGAVNRY